MRTILGSHSIDDAEAAACLSGPLAWMRPMLAPPEDPRPASPRAAFQEAEALEAAVSCFARRFAEALEAAVSCFARRFEEAPRGAAASVWSQYFLACLILPLGALALLKGAEAPEDLLMILDEEGTPVAAKARPRLTAPAAEGDALESLLTAHVRPFVEAFALWAKISPRVVWGNAAHYLEWLIRHLAQEGRLSAEAAGRAEDLLTRPLLPKGGRNPLQGAIHYGEGPISPEARRRRVCCLRFQIVGIEGCGALCPKPCSGRSRAA